MVVRIVATVSGPFAAVYDLGMVVDGDVENARVGEIPVPDQGDGETRRRGYHDFYLGYHPDTGTDRFYGGGTGGYYVYDVTDVQNPSLLTQIVGVSGKPRYRLMALAVSLGKARTHFCGRSRYTIVRSTRRPALISKKSFCTVVSATRATAPVPPLAAAWSADTRRGRPSASKTWFRVVDASTPLSPRDLRPKRGGR